MPRSRSELMNQLIEDVAKLVKPYDHQEPLVDGGMHVSRHPSLLGQLWAEINYSTPAPDPDKSSRSSMARSKPPMNENLMEHLIRAQDLSSSLVVMSGGRLSRSMAENFWQLPSVMIHVTDEMVDHVAGQVNFYKRQLEQILTWTEEPHKISSPCPACNAKHAIVIQIDRFGPLSARCIKCHATWDKTTLGVLAGSIQETPKKEGA